MEINPKPQRAHATIAAARAEEMVAKHRNGRCDQEEFKVFARCGNRCRRRTPASSDTGSHCQPLAAAAAEVGRLSRGSAC